MNNRILSISFSLIAPSGAVLADTPTITDDTKTPARAAFFVGIGGGYGNASVTQSTYARGVSQVYTAGTTDLISNGPADESTGNWSNNQSTFAPIGQAGYFQHFGDSDWLWGSKFLYRYYGTTSNQKNVVVPQAGYHVAVPSGSVTPFTGFETIDSLQTSVNSQLGLLAFFGKSFGKSRVYIGAGPAAYQIQTNINNNVGYAYIPPPTINSITGAPVSYSSTEWVMGGAFELGGSYYIDRSWFIDANYSLGVTANKTTNYSGAFTNTADGDTTVGTNYLQTRQSFITNEFTVSINKAF